MFFVLAFICMILPIVSLSLEDKMLPRKMRGRTKTQVRLGGYFWLLIIAQTLVAIFFVGHLTRSLAMTDLGFHSAAISRVVAVGGAVTLPFPFLIGWIPDKFGRKRLLALCYLAGIIGISSQAISISWWHFSLSTVRLAFVPRVGGGVGSALVSDLVPKESLGMGIAYFQACGWLAGIIGWSVTGCAIHVFGLTSSMIMALFLPLAAIILLIFIRPAARGNKLAGSI